MILGTQEEVVTRMKCVLLIGNNVLIIHRVLLSSIDFSTKVDLV